MGRLRVGMLGALLCALFLIGGGSAAATTAMIVSPAPGDHVANGFTGPVTVSFGSDLTPGTFTIALTGASGYSESQQVTVNAAGNYDYVFAAANAPGTYTATVADGGGEIATSTFTVDASTADDAAILSPESGAQFVGPTNVTVQVQWNTVDSSDEYSIEVSKNESQATGCSYPPGAGLQGETTSCTVGPLSAGTYSVAVINETTQTTVTTSSFVVVPLAVTATGFDPTIFLPFERDGVRDHTTGHFTLNAKAKASVRIKNRKGHVVRHRSLGTLDVGRHTWKWSGKNDDGHLVKPGRYTITFRAKRNGHTAKGHPSTVEAKIGLRLTKTSVSPVDFYPIKHDGYRDQTTLNFTTNKRSADRVEVRNASGHVVRHIRLGTKGAGHHHASWNGKNDNGSKVAPGTYHIRVIAQTSLQTKASHWLKVVVHKGPSGGGGGGGGGGSSCAASYPDFCIPPPPPDLDCSDINHTNFTVLWNVPNPDPHHFDGDHDGVGCES